MDRSAVNNALAELAERLLKTREASRWRLDGDFYLDCVEAEALLTQLTSLIVEAPSVPALEELPKGHRIIEFDDEG